MRFDAVPPALGEQFALEPAEVVTQSRLPVGSYQYLAVAAPMVASVVRLPARMVLSPSSFAGSSKVYVFTFPARCWWRMSRSRASYPYWASHGLAARQVVAVLPSERSST